VAQKRCCGGPCNRRSVCRPQNTAHTGWDCQKKIGKHKEEDVEGGGRREREEDNEHAALQAHTQRGRRGSGERREEREGICYRYRMNVQRSPSSRVRDLCRVSSARCAPNAPEHRIHDREEAGSEKVSVAEALEEGSESDCRAVCTLQSAPDAMNPAQTHPASHTIRGITTWTSLSPRSGYSL
jgi:hypothetical protein